MRTWRLLDSPPMTAAENFALDDTLLTLKGRQESPDTIRFLQFKPRVALVGYHQCVSEEIRTQYCLENGIDINRRITGGGAILFDENDLGWEMFCDKAFFNIRVPAAGLFRRFCEPVVSALNRLGIPAEFRPRNDIEVNGRKISGSGGTENGEGFMYQGTLLVDFDVDTMLKCLRIPIEKLKAKEIDSIKERVTCMNWELGHTPDTDQIKAKMRYAFEQHFNVKLESGDLTLAEEKLFAEKLAFYQSHEWIHGVDPKVHKREMVQAACKTENGLVRFSLAVNLPRKRLKDIYITGDIFTLSPRALYDLEAHLRGMPLDRDKLYDAVRSFFDSGRIRIPGMNADDFFIAMDQALEKIAVTDYGLSLAHCNRISVVNGSFADVIQARPSVLLLPYCAKSADCELRYKKACRSCGECSTGSAWTMGTTRNMRTVCVTSFEDLMQELNKMNGRGEAAFIGCCCQPFFIKHLDDFKKAGVPGILLDIDNTTCYDLGQSKEAYAGNFESQTHLDLTLLNAVLDVSV